MDASLKSFECWKEFSSGSFEMVEGPRDFSFGISQRILQDSPMSSLYDLDFLFLVLSMAGGREGGRKRRKKLFRGRDY